MRDRLERLVADTAGDVVSFDDLGRGVLPLLERLFQTRSSLLYRSQRGCPVVPLCRSDLAELAPTYVAHYLGDDPLQVAIERTNPWIIATNRCPEWKDYLRTPARAWWARQDVLYFFHARLLEGAHYSDGMIGYVLARAPGQPAFSAEDEALAARLQPALQAAARRCARTLTSAQAQQTLEGLIEGCGRPPTLAADLTGRLLWASTRATDWLGGLPKLPAPLVDAARRLGPRSSGDVVELRAHDGSPLRAELRLCRPQSGEPFVAVELALSGIDPAVSQVAARHGLTDAETVVLAALARGARDREIGASRGTSLATVRTHVTRILSKLGVRSRLEAALLVRGSTWRSKLQG